MFMCCFSICRSSNIIIPIKQVVAPPPQSEKSTLSSQVTSIAVDTLQPPPSTVNNPIALVPQSPQPSTSLENSPQSRINYSALKNQQEKIDIVHDLRNEEKGLEAILKQLSTNHSSNELHDIIQPVETLATELNALLNHAKMTGGIELARFEDLIKFLKSTHLGSNELRAKKLLISDDDNFYLNLFNEYAQNMINVMNNVSSINEFSLSKFLEKVLLIKSVEAKIKNITLKILCKTTICDTVKGDSLRLKRILINLVSNAINYTEKGSIEIAVSMENLTLKGVRFRFEVKDSGMGIPSDKKDRLFKRYSQINEVGSQQYGQIGLGLSICKSLVTALNEGTNEKDEVIGVESVLGQSSTFWFTVPLEIISKGNSSLTQYNTSSFSEKRLSESGGAMDCGGSVYPTTHIFLDPVLKSRAPRAKDASDS